jgi:hypothetical protein
MHRIGAIESAAFNVAPALDVAMLEPDPDRAIEAIPPVRLLRPLSKPAPLQKPDTWG